MTYDVLEKVTKAELILWMRRNIMLPPITDEEFLREAKLRKLINDSEELFKKQDILQKKMNEAMDDHFKFMALMVESNKLNEKIEANAMKINELIGVEPHD